MQVNNQTPHNTVGEMDTALAASSSSSTGALSTLIPAERSVSLQDKMAAAGVSLQLPPTPTLLGPSHSQPTSASWQGPTTGGSAHHAWHSQLTAGSGSQADSPQACALLAVRRSYPADALPSEDGTDSCAARCPSSSTPRPGLREKAVWEQHSRTVRIGGAASCSTGSGADFAEEASFPSQPSAPTPRVGLGPAGAGAGTDCSGKGAAPSAAVGPRMRPASVFATAHLAAVAAAGDAHRQSAPLAPGNVLTAAAAAAALHAVRQSYPSELPPDVEADSGAKALSHHHLHPLAPAASAPRLATAARPSPTGASAPPSTPASGNSVHCMTRPASLTGAALFPPHPSVAPGGRQRRGLLSPATSVPPSSAPPPTPVALAGQHQAGHHRVLTLEGAAVLRALQASYPHLQDDFAVEQQDGDEDAQRGAYEPLPSAAIARLGLARSLNALQAPPASAFAEDTAGDADFPAVPSSALPRAGLSSLFSAPCVY